VLSKILIALSMGGFAALLLTSFYFRWRVLKAYHILRRNNVAFDKSHIFDSAKLEAEILPRYPNQRQAILDFVGGIRFAMKLASWLIVMVTACAAVLMFMAD
jgi:hypothetical protein